MHTQTAPHWRLRALAAGAAILALNTAAVGATLWVDRAPAGGQADRAPETTRAATTPAHATQRHVIHISVDGLGTLWYAPLLQAGLLPSFAQLQRDGAWTHNARSDPDFTITLPNHTGMLTGRPVQDKQQSPDSGHRWITNITPLPGVTLHTNAGYYVPSVFDVAHDHGLSTALYASKEKFVLYEQSYDMAHGAHDALAPDHGRDKIDRFVNVHQDSTSMVSALLRDLAASPAQYTFVHFHDADTAGHAHGWGSAPYNAAVRAVDAQLGLILDAIDASDALRDNTWIVLSADHGGADLGHSDASLAANFTLPLIVWGPGLPRGVDLYALNGASTADPGVSRPDYGAAHAPIRNTDTGNCALGLLGLPAMPGALSDGLRTACRRPG